MGNFSNVKITDESGKTIFEDDFSSNEGKWSLGEKWVYKDGWLTLESPVNNPTLCICNTLVGDNYDLWFNAKKRDFNKADKWYGFSLYINYQDNNNYTVINLNAKDVSSDGKIKSNFYVENCIRGRKTPWILQSKDGVEPDVNYDIHIVVRKGEVVACMVNGGLGLVGDNAVKVFKKQASLGDVFANYVMGILYQNGIGGTKVRHKYALQCYSIAANSGYVPAFRRLANYYLEDHGVFRDIKKGGFWMEKAIDAGDAKACWEYGMAYYNGKSYETAAKYFAKAVEMPNGGEEVCKNVLNVENPFYVLTRNGYIWSGFRSSCSDAIFAHEYATYKIRPTKVEHPFMESVKKDHPRGCKNLQELAEQGNIDAVNRYTAYLWMGELKNIPQDRRKAVEYCKKYPNATTNRLLVIAKGEGLYDGPCNKDWYNTNNNVLIEKIAEKAAENGNVEALAMLRRKGVEKHKQSLTEQLNAGNYHAAELMDDLEGHLYNDKVLLLFKTASKTGYDKCAQDLKRVEKALLRADSLTNAGVFERLDKRSYPNRYEYAVMAKFYTDHPEYDKCNITEKAKRLANFDAVSYAVLVGDPQTDDYWGISHHYPEWYGARWTSIIYDGLSLCRSANLDSRYASYYKKALPILEKKVKHVESVKAIAMEQYQAAISKKKTDDIAKEKQETSTIDSKRSKSPSGELTRGFFGTFWYHENRGEIYFKRGSDYIYYNRYYNDYEDGKFLYYKINDASDKYRSLIGKEFKAYGDMMLSISELL